MFRKEKDTEMEDKLIIGGHAFESRFILGSGKFSLEMTNAVIKNGGVERRR